MRSILRKVLWETKRIKCELEKCLPSHASAKPPVFLVGCGRSGTTILGEWLGRQRGVVILNEPRDRWFAIDPRTDDIGLYRLVGQLDFGEAEVTRSARYASHLISQPIGYPRRHLIVEKSPSNVFRLPWLRILYPNCQFVNLLRDGTEVVASICALAESNSYGIASRGERNQWWGRNSCKRDLILRRAQLSGMLSGDPEGLPEKARASTAALAEWVMSVEAMACFVETYGRAGVFNVRYEDIIKNPELEITNLLALLGVNQKLVSDSVADVFSVRKTPRPQFEVLCEDADVLMKKRFWETMKKYGYA